MRVLALGMALLMATSASFAAKDPASYRGDPRVRAFTYDENEVFNVMGNYGVSTIVKLHPDEEIINTIIGDQASWETVYLGNHFILKPIAPKPETDLIIETDERLYAFHLSAKAIKTNSLNQIDKNLDAKTDLYIVRFNYPGEASGGKANTGYNAHTNKQITTTPLCINFKYARFGNKEIVPEQACDDGRYTYLLFDKHQPLPAVFLTDGEGHEEIINFAQHGPYLVIKQLGQHFGLRYGTKYAAIFNDTPTINYE